MSSPFHRSDTFRSTPKTSPSRQRLGDSRNGLVNGHHRATSESISDSPTQQLHDDFSRLLLDEYKAFEGLLDSNDAEQKRLHREALDAAHERHEAIWQSAERARETLELNIRLDRLRREDEEKRVTESARRELAEKEVEQQRRQLEVAKREEEERNQLETVIREQEEQKQRADAQKQREEQEAATRKAAAEKDEADRKAREEAAALERRQQAQRPPPAPAQPQQQTNGVTHAVQSTPAPAPQPQQPPATQPQPAAPIRPAAQPQPAAQLTEVAKRLTSSNQEREAVHRRYVDMWKRLKVMRKSIEKQCRDVGFKDLGNWRRDVRSRLGQLNKVDKQANTAILKKVRAVLDQAARMTEPSVDASQFIVYPDQPPASESANTSYPGILLYLLSHLAKSAIGQLLAESAVDTAMADPVGVLLCSVFSVPDYRWNGQSMIDVLWAKYHVLCPPLFGIYGSEATPAGHARLGWRPDCNGQAHYTRMTGLGAGFSALTLRDFSKSRNRNPAPNRMWWESMARILNLPAGEAQATHYVLVKAMIEDFVPRIMQIFASAGKAALKKAVREFPYAAPKKDGRFISPAVAVEAMQVTLQQRYGLTL
ncbi:hypothetical protein LTR08_005911 [Meristemomyces frigidus]|nr:hypothetical protein LTR08_005911 [Meristemomyces frigidus]